MNDDNPKVRFGDGEVSTSRIWKVLETTQRAAELLNRLNNQHPDLATEYTRTTFENVKKRLSHLDIVHATTAPSGSIEIIPPQQQAKPNESIEDVAERLLASHSPEEVVEILADQYHHQCDIGGVLLMVGQESYERALTREALEMLKNSIGYEQIADLWNDFHRPVAGKPFWDARYIKDMVQNYQT